MYPSRGTSLDDNMLSYDSLLLYYSLLSYDKKLTYLDDSMLSYDSTLSYDSSLSYNIRLSYDNRRLNDSWLSYDSRLIFFLPPDICTNNILSIYVIYLAVTDLTLRDCIFCHFVVVGVVMDVKVVVVVLW